MTCPWKWGTIYLKIIRSEREREKIKEREQQERKNKEKKTKEILDLYI